jgi:hypothetical protein
VQGEAVSSHPKRQFLAGSAFIGMSMLMYLVGIWYMVAEHWDRASAVLLSAVYLFLFGRWQQQVAFDWLEWEKR